MQVSYRWLSDFLDLTVSKEAVNKHCEQLTMAGAEVEGVDYLPGPSEIIVGEVADLSPHPEADNLFLAEVDVGGENVPTITAADNLYKKALVPILPAPGKFPDGTAIETKSFRGEESKGTLCSKEELGLEEKSSGIWLLDNLGFSVGDRLSEEMEFDDYILQFEITSNRPDLLGVLGIARELSVLTGKELTIPDPHFKFGRQANVEIEIENPNDTPRYTARTLKGVEVQPSPVRIQHRLAKAGFRPRNNVVDATNYAMLELGHPLHPFDLHQIKGNKIKIRRAKSGESLITLDGNQRILNDINLVIADEREPVALAGVMGGQSSEVSDSSTEILLEGACFEQSLIRRSSQNLGLTTEASRRFEKGMDPQATELAIDRVTELLDEQNCFQDGSILVDEYPNPVEEKQIKLRKNRLDSNIGVKIPKGEITRILDGLGAGSLKEDGSSFLVTPPSWRVDLTREVDLIEEVARVYGYDRIPETPPSSGTVDLARTREETATEEVRRVLTGLGLYEIISPGFHQENRLFEDEETVQLRNPMGKKRAKLRTEIAASLIKHADRNFKDEVDSLRFFEIGNIFAARDEKTEEKTRLGVLLSGRRYEGVDQKRKLDFWDLKGVLEDLFSALRIYDWKLEPGGPESFHPGRKGQIFVSNNPVGFAGQLHPDRQEDRGLPEKVFLAELEFDVLTEQSRFEGAYNELPRFPSSKRDLSFSVPEGVEERDVRSTILAPPRVEKVYLYDIYQGDQVESGRRSLTYEVTFRDGAKTLNDEEVDEVVETIRSELEDKGVTFRG